MNKVAFLVCTGWLACAEGPTSASEFGQSLFHDSRLAVSSVNRFSCQTCHNAREANDSGRIDSGYSLFNSAHRSSYWGGYELGLLDAVNFCLVNFMRSAEPLDAQSPKSRALYEYLVSISPDTQSAAWPLTVVKQIADLPRTDAGRGREVYVAACQGCHGEFGNGKGRLTERAPLLPDVFTSYAEQFSNVAPGLVVIEKIRHGPFLGIGGNMPLYSREALSDSDVGALLAFFNL